MSKHTPGPWRSELDEQGAFRVRGPNGIISDTIGRESNARLIAAAPDLIIAVRAAIRLLTREQCARLTVTEESAFERVQSLVESR